MILSTLPGEGLRFQALLVGGDLILSTFPGEGLRFQVCLFSSAFVFVLVMCFGVNFTDLTSYDGIYTIFAMLLQLDGSGQFWGKRRVSSYDGAIVI